eukprot:GHVO01029023.1.p2 GENE.GHVO01029023.1~~GHVO01029023.1.p2  ORF type:complete len:106 (+),score=28.17 GHVO01029023.1:140-457(+)
MGDETHPEGENTPPAIGDIADPGDIPPMPGDVGDVGLRGLRGDWAKGLNCPNIFAPSIIGEWTPGDRGLQGEKGESVKSLIVGCAEGDDPPRPPPQKIRRPENIQ